MTKEIMTGGSSDYYKVRITNPTSGTDSYTAECNDIIEALNMSYAEGNVFKAIWRMCASRILETRKKGYDDGMYDAEKAAFFSQRLIEQIRSKRVIDAGTYHTSAGSAFRE